MTFDLFYWWVEYAFLVLLVIGFILAASAGSAVITYITIILIGVLAARSIYKRKKGFKFPAFVILIGFLIGYVLGSFYGNRKLILILFVAGYIFSYYIHYRKWVK